MYIHMDVYIYISMYISFMCVYKLLKNNYRGNNNIYRRRNHTFKGSVGHRRSWK